MGVRQSFGLFLLSVLAGAVVTALSVIALKRWVRRSAPAAAPKEAAVTA